MKKGQGSLEYLLILAAILAIAVVVVVVANSLLSAPQQQTKLGEDKYTCSLQGIELVGYSTPGVVPGVKYSGETCTTTATDTATGASCTVHDASGNDVEVKVLQDPNSITCQFDPITASPPA
ncbi:class III signal peptide-containing protein [archaeon]